MRDYIPICSDVVNEVGEMNEKFIFEPFVVSVVNRNLEEMYHESY